MKSLLIESGYRFNSEAGFWHRPEFSGIDYCDGDEIESRIGRVIKEAADVSLFSEELGAHCTDWPSTYHLSPLRANILRPFESLISGDVLEIGAGCGAITRFLGESGGTVLALEGAPRRAAITRERTRDLSNVTVVSENFDHFECKKRFDLIVMIGVLEYASMFIRSEDPAAGMLQRVYDLLKPGGRVVVAIENQLGLKYFAGAPEDHIGLPMYGIEGRYRDGQPKTYGKRELTEKFCNAGFGPTEFLAPFPDYKLPISIVTESGFTSPDFDGAAFAWQSGWSDVQLPQHLAFSPTLVWPTLEKNGLGLDLANSFLIIAGREAGSLVDDTHLAWHFSTSRKKQFCKVTLFARDSLGEIAVIYRSLFPRLDTQANNYPILQSFPDRDRYIKGKSLSWEIVKLLSQDGWKLQEISQLVVRYLDILKTQAAADGLSFWPNSYDTKLPGFLYDCLPQNIITDEDGISVFIDREWIVPKPLEVGHLLMRALIVPSLNFLAKPQEPKEFDGTRLGLLLALAADFGWSLSREKVFEYAEQEVSFLQQILSNPPTLSDYLRWLCTPEMIRLNINQLLSEERTEYNRTIAGLRECMQLLEDKNQEALGTIAEIGDKFLQVEAQRANLEERIQAHEETISALSTLEVERARLERSIQSHEEMISQLNNRIEVAHAQLHGILASRSWRLTESLRRGAGRLRVVRGIVKLVRREISHNGFKHSSRRALRLLQNAGVKGACRRIAGLSEHQSSLATEASDFHTRTHSGSLLSITPYYVDPQLDVCPSVDITSCSVAVHLHLFYIDMLEAITARFRNIRRPFDLLVSVPKGTQCSYLVNRIHALLPNARNVFVEEVPNRGRDIAPMIVQFGQRLLNYDIIGHFHTKKSPHNQALVNWCDEVLGLLLGEPDSTGGTVGHIFQKLMTSAKVVYPEGRCEILQDRSRWGENYELASSLIKKYTNLSIEQFTETEFPEGSMFWARSECLRDMLQLPLTFNDFPCEPIPADGTIAHALERLILIFASASPGESLRLHRRDSLPDYRCYESQEDFQTKIIHDEVKILSYYLPQFHPIPENDAWHGEGFTEWTKVRGANPLFRGHYQQHIPHSDIGYYLLDSPDVLRTQADMMKKAGVFGQVFYHYWFNGRLILEQPAKMLLDATDIQMPFCFCWANENWTRRWDGNEAEVLLAQKYSDSDARAFMKYLIPFFQDTRYIRVEGRPVLFVYRPSSIPDIGAYLKIWREECFSQGIPAPYVVAVLTRGATDPADFGMDGGVERVLHDWTEGGAPEIKGSVSPYAPINGSILAYEDVARFYSGQTAAKDFTYFRSIIPMWDNTARYGSEAYVVHGSTPEVFQDWLEKLILYTKDTLPADRRFLLVNAWNEWAEGAHLEPDSRYGYSYLNSVGRALSKIPYASQAKTPAVTPRDARIHLVFPEYFQELLSGDGVFAKRLNQSLVKSTFFDKFTITVDATVRLELPSVRIGNRQDADWVLEFRRPAFFSVGTIEAMINLAFSRPESVVVPNYYGDNLLIEVGANGSIAAHDAFRSPLVLYPARLPDGGYKNFRICLEARCFLTQPNNRPDHDLPIVSTIIRFHKSGDIQLLRNALGCLVAMHSCICVPLIAAQDLSDLQQVTISNLLSEFSWHPHYPPQIYFYQSVDGNGDLRSKMLNESLRKVQSRYAAFLDYDDLLMPHAYDWLIRRLEQTSRAVAFGRVYSTLFTAATGLILNRSRAFEYGFCYDDFLSTNHAPLHSFLIDLKLCDIGAIKYHDDHRFEEDYFLTLQLFTEKNGDWDGLKLNHYLGDYVHSTDMAHTLAFIEDIDRERVLKNPEYIKCKNRIRQLINELASKRRSLKQAIG